MRHGALLSKVIPHPLEIKEDQLNGPVKVIVNVLIPVTSPFSVMYPDHIEITVRLPCSICHASYHYKRNRARVVEEHSGKQSPGTGPVLLGQQVCIYGTRFHRRL